MGKEVVAQMRDQLVSPWGFVVSEEYICPQRELPYWATGRSSTPSRKLERRHEFGATPEREAEATARLGNGGGLLFLTSIAKELLGLRENRLAARDFLPAQLESREVELLS